MPASSGLLRFPIRVELPARSSAVQPEPGARAHLMGQIIEINPTATRDFLARFGEKALGDYLDHLQSAQEPRGPGASRLRAPGRPAVTQRRSRDV